MKKFQKPALTFQDQVNLLKSRGLEIVDEPRAARHLSNVSYYRLSAYMIPFRKRDAAGKITDDFEDGTMWDDVYNLYRFDRKLRLLIFDAIERIEIALRTQVINQLSLKYGSHWPDDSALFKTQEVFTKMQERIEERLKANSRMEFIKHYHEKYNHPLTPPSWMTVELLCFGDLSWICKSWREKKDVTAIARSLGIPQDKILHSWLRAINYVRNICAHHARLWNITFTSVAEPTKANIREGRQGVAYRLRG
ncbi:MAG: Abi family protein [Rikenellaceae bacterium]|nr:Abi family protein [Rikenellaceae bacterium]MCL2692937.1 Abi family protein [Rikenellaceae bacterium]